MDITAKAPLFPSCRASLCLVGFGGALIYFLTSSNISVVLVCMTTPEYTVLAERPAAPGGQRAVETPGMTREGRPELAAEACRGETYSRAYSNQEAWYNILKRRKCAQLNGNPPNRKWKAPEFFWSRDVKGLILSAFGYGHLCTQFFASIMAKKFGAKKVIVIGYAVEVAATVLGPVTASWSPYALAALQAIKGMAAGLFFPCYMTMWGKWAPPLERTTLVGFMLAGNSVGNILAFALTGYICDNLGWESVFYIYGILGAAWIVAFMFFVYDDPEVHPRISTIELAYLRKNIISTKRTMPLKDVPWKSIFTSVAVWAVALSEVGFSYGYFMMLTEVPQYLVDVMHTDISADGLYTALPHISSLLICFIAPLVSDWMIRKGVKKVNVRKLMQSIALIPAGCMMFGIGYLGSDQLSIALACLGVYGLSAANRSGGITNIVEIAPKYAGIVYGIVNTLASIPGSFAPFITGVLVENGTEEEWRTAFLVSGIFSFVGVLVYLIFAKADVQPWAVELTETEDLEKRPLNENEDTNGNNNVNSYKYGSVLDVERKT